MQVGDYMYYKNNKIILENKNDIKWMNYYEMAKQYYEEKGNLQIPLLYEVNGYKLGKWIQTQRSRQRGKGNLLPLSELQLKLLNDIKMIWEINNVNPDTDYINDEWMTYYNLAKQYYEQNGNLLIPISYEVDGYKLGRWLSNQRRIYKRQSGYAELPKKKYNLLNEIDMVWYDAKEELRKLKESLIEEDRTKTK